MSIFAKATQDGGVRMDETPTKENDNKDWMWVAATSRYAVYAIFSTRAATAISHLLGTEFQGIVNCDRAKMNYCLKHMQWCRVHLIRDIQDMIDSGVDDRVYLGMKLAEQSRLMFANWHQYKSKEVTWKEFQVRTIPVIRAFKELLYQRGGSHDKKRRNQCLQLHEHRANLWRCVCQPGIEPTNNAAKGYCEAR